MRKQLLIGLIIGVFLLPIGLSREAFLQNGVGVRSTSMGQAPFWTADAESMLYNPASISWLEESDVSFATDRKFNTLDELYVAAVTTLFGYNVGFTYFNVGWASPIIGTSYDSGSDTITSSGSNLAYNEMLLMGTLAAPIGESIGVGINGKLLLKTLDARTAKQIGIDLGVSYKASPKLNLFLKAEDVFSTGYAWSTEREYENINVVIGFGSVMDGLVVNGALDLQGSAMKIASGIEWDMSGMLLRGGFHSDYLGAGIGLHFSGIDLDYGYTHYLSNSDLLGSVHRIGIGFQFGSYDEPVLPTIDSNEDEILSIEKSGDNLDIEEARITIDPAEKLSFSMKIRFDWTRNGVLSFEGKAFNEKELMINFTRVEVSELGDFYYEFKPKGSQYLIQIEDKNGQATFLGIELKTAEKAIINGSTVVDSKVSVNGEPLSVETSGIFNTVINSENLLRSVLEISIE
jgi:hypothetical protein